MSSTRVVSSAYPATSKGRVRNAARVSPVSSADTGTLPSAARSSARTDEDSIASPQS